MKKKELNGKDEIYLKKRKDSLPTISFMKAIMKNLDFNKAFKITEEAFSNYMTSLYEDILEGTEEGSQERFNKFRRFYEDYASKTSYLEIIKSNKNILKVKYNRCPFFEVCKVNGLQDLVYAFCLSDPGFTRKVLPNVTFSREKVIAKGDNYCDNTWNFKL